MVHLPTGKILPIINVYMHNNYWEKLDCWDSLLGISESGFHQNCIITRDFNIAINLKEKRGGSIIRYPSRENMEDLISTLDLFDVQPSKGKFTWNNRIVGLGHIAARLDHFLIHNSFLSLHDDISYKIIPWSNSDHRLISLIFSKEENLGPIPFQFNPLWMENPNLFPMVSRA
jgi:hypothetical protein